MAISKFLDPKNDFAFRRIFGSVNNKDILIHFLNDMLGLTGVDQIEDVSFLSPIQDPDIASQKQSIVDVLCTDSAGTQLIIEMQVVKTTGFEKRAQYYAAKAYSSQAHKGDQYQDLKGVIFIAIADFILFPNKLAYKSDHVTFDKITYEHDLKDFSFTFIELPKFNKTKEDQLSNIVEKWIYFFKYADETSEEDLQKIIGSDVIIGRAYDVLNQYNWSKEERFAYDQTKKHIDDYLSSIQQGKIEGIKIGEEKGRKEGREEGKIEGKIEVAKTMLANNIDINTIVKCTGLSISEIEELQN
ncbi:MULTISPECIES: Rpn family recombination-promoting nuclease/putative transposase [Wolbachia]|uniref:Rpn family recombination-promoting nuclease/putative transposase n=1 Tax=Wolbachia pipientis TaxID=955 RepID=A0A7G5CDB9_WOLPI|nr:MULTISPECIES: Rpn family recombination-promoting nuclease/putative transposase [Wolbachia]MDE5060678.1 Rpn family recombination-promoting nuclease/putative transposase [Wolbachia endosymbiont of Drosophila nikananu]MDE5062121.1 Rpn family recombination-promoting nuclease/putative transposase [Wolbachia endosymbiont of Drosophila tsacasi]QMV47203.1 Rpn family recombination-promoting nuclease/putative transposase [Wolbachia pipientis]